VSSIAIGRGRRECRKVGAACIQDVSEGKKISSDTVQEGKNGKEGQRVQGSHKGVSERQKRTALQVVKGAEEKIVIYG